MCHAMENPHTDILEPSLPLVVLESIEEIVARISKNWPVIIIMTVKEICVTELPNWDQKDS